MPQTLHPPASAGITTVVKVWVMGD
jgi:hypothetical protein